ncbi:APC family permease [Fluviispira multicolorata]|uniref:Amino acid transporter n=1 Tax=Fluviispira multicolorata TaxID=2654512 RepID=A0A833N6K0_9BACT|nr:APC family permease [Fluviispira multicolorata]KAB8030653.1 hypothetical protein GCL57_06675 [Fluviispira multicolorata]
MDQNQKNKSVKSVETQSHPFISKMSYFLTKSFHFKNDSSPEKVEKTHHWFSVLCLTGVDYFSTLAYQPGIALMAVAALAPFSTLLLILLTLFGAVPTYIEVSKRSYTGQGSIAMLENLLSGWSGKFVVLGLIAFAVTDFFITITLSASDAASHIIENPLLNVYLGHSILNISIYLIILLGVVFFIGFKEAINVAIASTIPFLILTLIVICRATFVIIDDPYLIYHWISDPIFKVDWFGLFVISALAFPKLALGLSGFETGVSVMPLIDNGKGVDAVQRPPMKRIAGTKKLLLCSAIIMSIYLIASSVVTSILLKQSQVMDGAEASGRALSYLAHKYIGNIFGTVYDISTIIILWFAGASAMAGLLNVIPRYLPRFGMAPRWVEVRRPLVVLITLISVAILIIFQANVNAQAGAYATGVLALILSASVAVALSLKKDAKLQKDFKIRIKSYYFWLVSAVFLFTLIDNVNSRPDGLVIAFIFFLAILFASAVSRWRRAFELRVESHKFMNDESVALWTSITDKKVNLVPISSGDKKWFKRKEEKIKRFYKCTEPLAFLTVSLRDDRSEFVAPLFIKVLKMEDNSENFLIEVSGAVAIPNTVAYISEQIDPIAIYLGLARKNAMEQAIFYVLFGEGEIGIITYKVLVQYWESTEEDDVRPVLFLMSE